MNKNLITVLAVALLLNAWMAAPLRAADEPIEIERTTELGVPPTPIAIVGFTGEVARVLNFDLTVMGFISVAPESANYILSGSDNENVQAKLSLVGQTSKSATGVSTRTSVPKSTLFSKSYVGSTLRGQAHRLADDVVQKITGVNGIAEMNGQIARIAFKVANGPTGEIYVSDFDGHDAAPATRDNSLVAAPCWVPGHFALFYTTYKRGPAELYYQDLRSAERRVFDSSPGMIGSAAVSPDGRKVAFISAKTGRVNLYVRNVDGSDTRQLTFTPEDDSSPCWSPDGRWICYASKGNERRALSRISVDGGAPQRISTAGFYNPSEPDWSPDGQWIAFTSQNSAGFDICVVPAKGGQATRIVSGMDPSWAPNSRTLIFVRRNGGIDTLSLLDVPTKQVKDVPRVSGSSSSNSQPSWAR